MYRGQEDILSILDQLCERLTNSGAVLFHGYRTAIANRATTLLAHPDCQHVPHYKLTELMIDLVNIAATISAEAWLSEAEAKSRFLELAADNSPLVQSFLSEAAMERARYEPMMLTENYESPQAERNAILRMRLKRMLMARQQYEPLPSSYVRLIRVAGSRAMQATCFRTYRIGAMLQFFADMIKQADQIHEETFDEFAGIAALNYLLREEGNLWKLYRHKAARFSAKPGDPLHEGAILTASQNHALMLDIPTRPTIH